jgi:GNAT superfamily N-acetyltransferase
MSGADAAAAVAIQVAAASALASQIGEHFTAPSPEWQQRFAAALQRFTEIDAPGCWLAEQAARPVGYAVAIRRDRLWGLATLFVHPDAQGRGVGRALVERTLPCAEGADVRIVLSSRDPRAVRRYAGLGLALHPAVSFTGTVNRTALPHDPAGRDGTSADLDLVDAVDRRLRRGASRVSDVAFALRHGERLHVIDRQGAKGWLVTGDAGAPLMLGADNTVTARALLIRAFTHSTPGERIAVHSLTAEQGWAVEPCLAAGLAVEACGPVFLSGWVRPPQAWLPTGIYF